jgi:hypothetical protein
MFVTRNSNGFLVTYSQNSSVSVVTELRAGRMDLDFRQLEGSICSQVVQAGCRVHPTPIKQPDTRSHSLGLRRPRREADHFHQSSASSNLIWFVS